MNSINMPYFFSDELYPEGTSENSPVIDHWEQDIDQLPVSPPPQGGGETEAGGTRCDLSFPTDQSVGYFRMPLTGCK